MDCSLFGTYKKPLVYVGTAAGIFLGMCKQRTGNTLDGALTEEIIDKINSVRLDSPALETAFGAYSRQDETDFDQLNQATQDSQPKSKRYANRFLITREL